MKKITRIERFKINRKNYQFKEKTVALKNEEGIKITYGCIVLVDIQKNEIVAYTGLERYVIDLSRKIYNESRARISTSRVIAFLNYILHETSINSINEVDINIIRSYLISRKLKSNGEELKGDSWARIRIDIFNFLENYYRYNNEKMTFSYNINEIVETKIITEKKHNGSRRFIYDEYKMLNVKPPKKRNNRRRNRVLMYGHMKALLYAAKKYEPMIYLALMLMAYAGLREGEVVNLTFDDIEISKKLGVVQKISLSLENSDRFRRGKSHTGVIKKTRTQDVFDGENFFEDIEKAIAFHKRYLESLGLPSEGTNPILYNKQKRPMSVTTFTKRLRDLFYNHFLRVLKESSIATPFEGETYAYIEKYEEEYPGAHMMRHWFTMYLITKAKLKDPMIKKARGDSKNSDAYLEYMDINKDLIEEYKKTAYSFQESLLEDVYE